MSYDILIAAEPLETVSVEEIYPLLHRFGQVSGDGAFLVAEDEAGEVHIEIDLELADENGDTLEETGGRANQVRLQIPYPVFEASKGLALEITVAVADGLGWTAWDEQTGAEITALTETLDEGGLASDTYGALHAAGKGPPRRVQMGCGRLVWVLVVVALSVW